MRNNRPPEVNDAVFPALCAGTTAAIASGSHMHREHLLTAENVSKVSRPLKEKPCQPRSTCGTWDGSVTWSPITPVLNLITEVGVSPSYEQEMLTAQCIKPAGGRRPIGQFKSLRRF